MSNNTVFKAIADSTRRHIIAILVASNTMLNIHTISNHFDISRQAISKHLKILENSGIVKVKKIGRERLYLIDLNPLKDVDTWVENYRKFWTIKLDSLGNFLDQNETSL